VNGCSGLLTKTSSSLLDPGGTIALERYDLVIVGGGAAGINALKTAVSLTARVALVDRGPLGGTCVNRG
jgi:alanine dehydrogenase